MRWAGYLACIGQTKFLSENLKGRYHLEDLGVDEKITSEWILEK
jgi:hypothetical protein